MELFGSDDLNMLGSHKLGISNIILAIYKYIRYIHIVYIYICTVCIVCTYINMYINIYIYSVYIYIYTYMMWPCVILQCLFQGWLNHTTAIFDGSGLHGLYTKIMFGLQAYPGSFHTKCKTQDWVQ